MDTITLYNMVSHILVDIHGNIELESIDGYMIEGNCPPRPLLCSLAMAVLE